MSQPAAAAPGHQWVGPANGLWSNPANWSPAEVPHAGDVVTFPHGSSSRFDLSALQVGRIIIDGNPGRSAETSITAVGSATLGLADAIELNWVSGPVRFDVPVVLAAGDHEVGGGPSTIVRFQRTVSGPGSMSDTVSDATIELLAPNTFSGGMTIARANVLASTSTSLGTGPVALLAAGELTFGPNVVVANAIDGSPFGNTTLVLRGDALFTSPVEVTGGSISAMPDTDVRFAGGFTSTGGIWISTPPGLDGPPARVIADAPASVESLLLSGAEMEIRSPAGSRTVGGLNAIFGGRFTFTADGQHAPTGIMSAADGGSIDLAGTDQQADGIIVGYGGTLRLGEADGAVHNRSTLTAARLAIYGDAEWTIVDGNADLIRSAAVHLENAPQFTVQGTVPPGAAITLIENTSSSATSNGLRQWEGTLYQAGQQVFALSLRGGDGNDVTITRLAGLYSSWSLANISDRGGQLIGAPALSTWGAGRLDAWVVGADRALWHRSLGTNAGGWERLGGILTASPSAVSQRAGEFDVFARGADDGLWFRSFRGGAWGPWESLGGRITEAPAVTSSAPGNLEVVVRGGDDGLWLRRMTNGVWQPWITLGGRTSNAPAIADWGPGGLHVFVRGGDGALWQRSESAGAWGPWQSLGGGMLDGPAVAAPEPGQLAVFVRGGDGRVWHRSEEGAGWSVWESTGVVTTHRPAAVGTAPGQLALGIRATTGSLVTLAGMQPGGTAAAAAVAATDTTSVARPEGAR